MCRKEFYVYALAVYVAALGWIGISYHIEGAKLTLCPLLFFFGIPCPFCGLTHACHYLLEGYFADALATNPLVVLFPVVVLLPVLLADVCFHRSVAYSLFEKLWRIRSVRVILLLTLACVWAYKLLSCL